MNSRLLEQARVRGPDLQLSVVMWVLAGVEREGAHNDRSGAWADGPQQRIRAVGRVHRRTDPGLRSGRETLAVTARANADAVPALFDGCSEREPEEGQEGVDSEHGEVVEVESFSEPRGFLIKYA